MTKYAFILFAVSSMNVMLNPKNKLAAVTMLAASLILLLDSLDDFLKILKKWRKENAKG